MVDVHRIPEQETILLEFSEDEARDLFAVINSTDLLSFRVWDAVGTVKELTDLLRTECRFVHEDARRRLHERWNFGREVEDGFIFD